MPIIIRRTIESKAIFVFVLKKELKKKEKIHFAKVAALVKIAETRLQI